MAAAYLTCSLAATIVTKLRSRRIRTRVGRFSGSPFFFPGKRMILRVTVVARKPSRLAAVLVSGGQDEDVMTCPPILKP